MLKYFLFSSKDLIKFSSNGKKYEKWLENEAERHFMIIPVVYCYRGIIAKLLNSVNTTRKESNLEIELDLTLDA